MPEIGEGQLECVIDPASPVLPQAQIVDQIRILLLMGRLHPGDPLPSIRELERRLGIGRSIVWAAYRELQEADIITLQQGSRAQICQDLGKWKGNSARAQECEELSSKIIKEIQDQGFVLSSFVRYLGGRAREVEAEHYPVVTVDDSLTLATDYARQISEVWRIHTRPMRFTGTDLTPQLDVLKQVRCVITTFWFTSFAALAKPHQVPVFMVSTRWSAETLDPVRELPHGSKVLLLFYEEDYFHNGQAFANDLRQSLDRPGKIIVAAAIRELKDLQPVLHSPEYKRILVGNRIWDDLDEETRRSPKVGRLIVRLNEEDLEEIRIRAGVIL